VDFPPIPTDLILSMIGEDAGFKINSIIKCRRAATSGQQLKEFPYLKDLLRESIVTLERI
jgi:site-specific DNA-methyltransferase (adenine-specific)